MERTKTMNARPSNKSKATNGHGEDVEKAKQDMELGRHLPANTRLLPSRSPPRTSVYGTFFFIYAYIISHRIRWNIDYLPILLPLKPLFKLAKRMFMRKREGEEDDTNRNWFGKRTRPTISAESNVPLEIWYALPLFLE